MLMPLEDWDKRVSPHLYDIGANCRWIMYYTKHIAVALKALPVRPEWETIAEADLSNAIEVLDDVEKRIGQTLAALKAIKEKYHAKKVDA